MKLNIFKTQSELTDQIKNERKPIIKNEDDWKEPTFERLVLNEGLQVEIVYFEKEYYTNLKGMYSLKQVKIIDKELNIYALISEKNVMNQCNNIVSQLESILNNLTNSLKVDKGNINEYNKVMIEKAQLNKHIEKKLTSKGKVGKLNETDKKNILQAISGTFYRLDQFNKKELLPA